LAGSIPDEDPEWRRSRPLRGTLLNRASY